MSLKRNADRDGEVAEGAKAYTLTKPVNPVALDAEVTEAMNWRKGAGIICEGDPATASTESPVTLWVIREDIDTDVLRSTVTAHEVTEVEVTNPLLALRDKAEAGKDYTAKETQEILRTLVLQATAGL